MAAEEITAQSKALFIEYAKDASNWSGTPLVGGNVGGSKADAGNLTQLKKAGLVTTFVDDDCTWLEFTSPGKTYALQLGIDMTQ